MSVLHRNATKTAHEPSPSDRHRVDHPLNLMIVALALALVGCASTSQQEESLAAPIAPTPKPTATHQTKKASTAKASMAVSPVKATLPPTAKPTVAGPMIPIAPVKPAEAPTPAKTPVTTGLNDTLPRNAIGRSDAARDDRAGRQPCRRQQCCRIDSFAASALRGLRFPTRISGASALHVRWGRFASLVQGCSNERVDIQVRSPGEHNLWGIAAMFIVV